MQQYKLGAENGDKMASLELINIQMKNNPDNKQPLIETPTPTKK